jgi:polyhydroxybutyrate depolymerase
MPTHRTPNHRPFSRVFLQAFALLALLSAGTFACAETRNWLRTPAPSAAELRAKGMQERSLRVGQTERFFLVQAAPDGSKPAPVLLVLHGGTQSMRHLLGPNAGATQGWPALARRENAVLLIPNGMNADGGDDAARSDNQNWNDLRENLGKEGRTTDADDVGFLTALVDWAHANYRTDRARVYVTGASNGGMMTFRLLMEAPERFAAGAAFVAALPAASSRIKRPALATPLLIANGTLDPLVQWNGGSIAGNRGEMRSVASTISWWVDANQAQSPITSLTPRTPQQLPNTDPSDGCTIERQDYPANGAAGSGSESKSTTRSAPVTTYTLRGGGHTIPSANFPIKDTAFARRYIGPVCRDAEGIELAWEFLSQHRR